MPESRLRKRWSSFVDRAGDWVQGAFAGPAPTPDEATVAAQLQELRDKTPSPVLWMLGKTQSGKTSLVRCLTGADDAEIGNGFRPCTRTSRRFPFPTAEDPVLTFLDTRGVDEPDYDAAEDLAQFDAQAHVLLVTVRLRDFATGGLRAALATIRRAKPSRPVVLVLTCLHEAFPQQQHPQPYPFDQAEWPAELPPDLPRLVREQAGQFAGLVDRVVPVDLTRPEEGFTDTAYGGAHLKATLLALLPDAYRTVFSQLTELSGTFRARHLHRAMPVILRYTTLATTAGATPVPGVAVVLLPEIQIRMLRSLSAAPDSAAAADRFLERLGGSLHGRQALRELVKFVPWVGVPASAALAGRATYALGVAYCEALHATELGHTLSDAEVRQLYEERFQAAATAWRGAPTVTTS